MRMELEPRALALGVGRFAVRFRGAGGPAAAAVQLRGYAAHTVPDIHTHFLAQPLYGRKLKRHRQNAIHKLVDRAGVTSATLAA